MKLSLSRRGWENLSFNEIADIASRMNFGAVEMYDIQSDSKLIGEGGPFAITNTRKTLRTLKEHHLDLVCLDSSIDLSDKADRTSEVLRLIDIAESLGVPYVAIRPKKDDVDVITKRLDEIIPIAEKAGVTVLIKTTEEYADTAKLANLLDIYARDNLAALWEIDHPYVEMKEDPADTVTHLGAYIRHVHVCDIDAEGNHSIVGEGILPIEDIMLALSSVAYDGCLSLEWKPSWIDGLENYEVVFPYYVSYMEKYIHSASKKKLYLNHDNTGEYIWKKDELVSLTFSDVLDRVVEEFPDQYAFKYTTLNYTRTYEEFRRDVDDFARALVSMGVKAGSKVSVWATNIPEWYITFWAAAKIGAVLVTVNTAYKVHEIEYLLRQSDTHTLVMIESSKDSNYAESIRELCPELATATKGEPLHCKRLPFLRNIVTVGFSMEGAYTWKEAIERKSMVPLAKIRMMASRVKPTDVCNMQYTSGTTGFPKGVMLTHYSVVNNGKCIGDRMGLSTADRMMIQVPMFHCFGMVLSMTASMTHGTTMCPLPYFSAKAALDCINLEKITAFNGVPTMFIAMFSHPDYRKTDFSYMRTGIMAGAGCPPELMRRAADPNEMNMTGIVSVYGQTESSPGSTMSAWQDDLMLRTNTVGYAFPHVGCKVVDPETGEELPVGVDGEFCSRGYNQMKGYYKMPKATKETIDEEGWLHSGDLARKLEDGTYLITGRLKDMIIRGGENIYPKEIEEFYYTHDLVKDVQVIAVPDEKYGEEVCACIVLADNSDKDEAQLQEIEDVLRTYAKEKLASHKVPRYFIFMKDFPMNAAGKILKYKMREDAAKRFGKN